MVYRRTIQDKAEDQILIANADGSGPSRLSSGKSSGIKDCCTDPRLVGFGRPHPVGAQRAGAEGQLLCSILVLTPEANWLKSFPLPMIV